METEKNKYENPYRVPENYFREVNRKILSRTIEKKEKETPLKHYIFKPWYAVAAGIAALILIGFLTTRISGKNDLSTALTGLNTEAYIDDIDLSALEENAGSAGIYESAPEVSSDGIIEYLLQENIAVTDIYEQL